MCTEITLTRVNVKNFKNIFGFAPPLDGLTSLISNDPRIDIVKMDEKLSAMDPDYDNTECTYKGVEISMKNYVVKAYGNEAADAIETLI